MNSRKEKNEEILRKILPQNYQYQIIGVSVRKHAEVSNEVQLEAHFRVNVGNEDGFNTFLSDFSKCSWTSYNKMNQRDRSGKKASLYGVRKCIHNVLSRRDQGVGSNNKNGNKTGKIREPGKGTKCDAEIKFSISAPCMDDCNHTNKNTHSQKKDYPLEVKLYYVHNHAIAAADALRYRPVSEETKQLFIDLFEEDVSPSSAYRKVLDHFDSSEEVNADRFHVPDYKWVFNFHAKYIKDKFGSSNGVDVFLKIKENIMNYNAERGGELAKVEQTSEGETIIAICDMLNRRVHEHIPAAGDLMIMDATANLDRNDSKIFHLMCPSPIGGLPLGTIITTRGDETTIYKGLELYKSLLPENSFYGRGRALGPKLVITDDDAAERNSLQQTWPETVLLLCVFHHLQALWSWLWKSEHNIPKDDRPILFNLFKRVLYTETTDEYNKNVDNMKASDVYNKYENFKAHMEDGILPRKAEWSLRERYEKQLPTHNQNTSNYVEYSFRMTKDIQFNRLKAYNLTDLVDIILDDSKLYSRRCIDVSHNRNYHLFTYQKSKYIFNESRIELDEIIQLSETQYLVPSETVEDKLYQVDMESGLCECFQGFLKGPCKHKASVAKKYKVKNFDILPHENEKMRSFYYFLGTGVQKENTWFRPLMEEVPFPEFDWNENPDTLENDDNNSDIVNPGNINSDEPNVSTNDTSDNNKQKDGALASLRKTVSDLVLRIETRYDEDPESYKKSIKSFLKTSKRVISGNDATIQKALFTFAKEVIFKKGKRKTSLRIPVQNSARSRRTIKHRGRGPSIPGRPTNSQRLRLQLEVNETEEIVRHQIPSKKSKSKRKKPHSLSESVAANRSSERKH